MPFFWRFCCATYGEEHINALRSAPVLRITYNEALIRSLFAPLPPIAPLFVSLKTQNKRERDKREAFRPLPSIHSTNFTYSIQY